MIQVHAHRGASAYAPENTMPAFKKGVQMQADAVECDIHLTTDNVWIVCHDDSVERTSNGKGCISQMTSEEVRKLDFGGKFAPEFAGTTAPTLEELLEGVSTMKFINIEIKDPFREGEELNKQLDLFYDVLKKHNYCHKTLVSSFNHHVLGVLKERHPDLRTGLLYGEEKTPEQTLELVKTFHADAIHPYLHCQTPETVKACMDNGIDVNVWTVDSEEDISRAISLGVTGIISNVPDRVLKALNRT